MLRQLEYQFLVYRSIVHPFLVLSSIAVPCWLILRALRLRAMKHPVLFSREILLLIVVVYLCGLAAATLAPNHNERLLANDTTGVELSPKLTTLTCSSPALPRGSKARHFCVYNAKGNLLLFLPLGFLIPLVWRRLPFWKGILIALDLSVTIEIIQYVSRAWGSYRSADINDVILNVLGAGVCLALMSLLRRAERNAR
jgi:glycopeptide antibiotics resistance protein